MKSYAVIGTGAVGGYYGGRLANRGKTVHFLARSDYNHIKETGLRVDSPLGNFHLKDVSVSPSPEETPRADVLLIALKTTGNHSLKKLISPMVREKTAILILQNGLGIEEEVQAWFPENPVLGGMCFICSRKGGPGHVIHQDYGKITIGCLKEEHKNLVEEIALDMNESEIPATIVDDLPEARWRKLLWNIPYNGLSVQLGCSTDRIMKTHPSRQMVERIMYEVLDGAKACGITIEREAVDNMMAFTDKMAPYEPSMKLDYDFNRPMELEYIYRKPLDAALKNGCEMKSIWMLYKHLQFLEALKDSEE